MKHVKWEVPDEFDDTVHFLFSNSHTLCGLATEGADRSIRQGFKHTDEKVSCSICIKMVIQVKKVKQRELSIESQL